MASWCVTSTEKDKKYGALYNFDVLFNGQKGAVGMKLEVNGEVTSYATAARIYRLYRQHFLQQIIQPE